MKIDDSKTYDVFGVGNAIIDFILEVEEGVLNEFNLRKGHFKGVNDEELDLIFGKIEESRFRKMPGGSTCNIVNGVAKLGGKCVFCGKVGAGINGIYYEDVLTADGVKPRLVRGGRTGKALTFITPDTERSFAVSLGSAGDLVKEDIFEEDIKDSRIVHIEGYQLQNDKTREVALHVLDLAGKHNVPVSVDLNDSHVVKKNLEFIKGIVRKNVDIVFANELEAEAFTGTADLMEALDTLASFAAVAVVKNGSGGSYIRSDGVTIRIPCYKAKCIDTNGAGDMYAAGVLYGLCRSMSLEEAGNLGAKAAARVVEQIGARYEGKF